MYPSAHLPTYPVTARTTRVAVARRKQPQQVTPHLTDKHSYYKFQTVFLIQSLTFTLDHVEEFSA